MNMEPFEVYRCYLALRLHFTTDAYDAFKQKGRVKASKLAFSRRKDLMSIHKVSKDYKDEEVVDFLVANFVSGDRWGGLFDTESKVRYLSWKKKKESLTYIFKNEISLLLREDTLQSVLDVSNSQHPILLKKYLRNEISIETLTALNKIEPFVIALDSKLDGDVVWPLVSRTIKKYSPFLKFNKNKFLNILALYDPLTSMHIKQESIEN